MLKVLLFLKKRADIDLEQFIDYYENKHAPLIRRLIPTIAEFRRNYPHAESEGSPGGAETPPKDHPGFDVVTELWFESRADWASTMATIQRPEVAAEIEQDELNFLDRSYRRIMMVDEFG